MRVFQGFFLGVAVLAGACTDGSRGHVKAIATDLTGEENHVTPQTYLYWVKGETITRGVCDSEHGFVTRTACSHSTEAMDYDVFKTALNNGLSDYIAALEAQISDLTAMIDNVSGQIEQTRLELGSVEGDISISREVLVAAREEMVYLEDIVFDYRRQVELIEAKLQQAKAYDLETMAEIVAQDLERARSVLASIYGAVFEIEARLTNLLTYADELRSQLQPLIDQLGLLTTNMASAEAELAVSRELFAIYENTLVKLEDEINFYITSDQGHLFEANRRYVKLFYDIFAAQQT